MPAYPQVAASNCHLCLWVRYATVRWRVTLALSRTRVACPCVLIVCCFFFFLSGATVASVHQQPTLPGSPENDSTGAGGFVPQPEDASKRAMRNAQQLQQYESVDMAALWGSAERADHVTTELKTSANASALGSTNTAGTTGTADTGGTRSKGKRKRRKRKSRRSSTAVKKCVVCQEQPSMHINIPCGHKCLCASCFHTERQRGEMYCPMCMHLVEDFLHEDDPAVAEFFLHDAEWSELRYVVAVPCVCPNVRERTPLSSFGLPVVLLSHGMACSNRPLCVLRCDVLGFPPRNTGTTPRSNRCWTMIGSNTSTRSRAKCFITTPSHTRHSGSTRSTLAVAA